MTLIAQPAVRSRCESGVVEPVRCPFATASVGALLVLALAMTCAAIGAAQQRTGAGTPEKDLGDAGRLIIPSLNINEAELDDVLVALAQFSGLNIISGAKVKGKVSVYWQNVTVQEALEALLETNDLGYLFKNGIVRVLPADKLGEDEVIHVTRVFKLNYLSAQEMMSSLVDVTSSAGKIQVNQESSALIVTDRPERVAQIAQIIAQMDERFKQVLIEAQLWEVSLNDSNKVGIDWSVLDSDPSNRFDFNLGNAGSSVLNQVLPGGSMQFGFVRDGKTFAAFLNALRQTSDVNVLAHPYILARNNKQADIQLEDQLPFVETSISNGVVTESVNYQEVGIRLTVTPHITNDQHIIMDLRLSQRIPGPTVQLQNSTAFSVDQRIGQTTLIVPDTQTVLIGGLFDTNIKYAVDKVPVLGDLPLLGHFFRKKSASEDRTDLILCITPSIVKDTTQEDPGLQSRLSQFDRERENYARDYKEYLEWRKAARGGLWDKVKDSTYNNGNVILHGDRAQTVTEDMIPAPPVRRSAAPVPEPALDAPAE